MLYKKVFYINDCIIYLTKALYHISFEVRKLANGKISKKKLNRVKSLADYLQSFSLFSTVDLIFEPNWYLHCKKEMCSIYSKIPVARNLP